MYIRIFGVRPRKYFCAQARPRFILSSERVLGNKSDPMSSQREKILYRKAASRVDPTVLHQAG